MFTLQRYGFFCNQANTFTGKVGVRLQNACNTPEGNFHVRYLFIREKNYIFVVAKQNKTY